MMNTEMADSNGLSGRKIKRKNRCVFCLAITVIAALLLAILITILALTVFKPKKPSMTIEDVSLQDLHLSLNPAAMKFLINVTIGSKVKIHNPNKVGMRYKQGIAIISYRGLKVADSPIPPGRIGPNGDEQININATVMADRLISNGNFYSDVLAGALKFNTLTKLRGKVIILRVFKVHVTTSSSCDVNVHLSQQSVDYDCKYKAAL